MSGALLPPAPRWVQILAFGLVGLFVVELLLRTANVPVDLLAWWPLGTAPSDGGAVGFAPWQPLTRLFVQGSGASAVFRVVLGAFVLYLSLGQLERRSVGYVTLAAWAAGTALALGLDALGVLTARPALGWSGLIVPLIVLFGLQRPDGRILLWMVLPISGRLLVWGTLFVCTLVFLAERSLAAADAIGGWAGVYSWWTLFGPGARRRRLKRDARGIERDLQRFRVIEGGRRRDDEGPVH